MMYSPVFLVLLSTLATPLRACEGQCIIQITHAFVGNYSAPVQHAFAAAAALVAQTILPSHNTKVASKLVEPLLDAYEHGAYEGMRQAIFPDYFHGKCQVNGVDPRGCPNPDCPVVCGTPGSMVHFYDTLKRIAFNTTTTSIERLCLPPSRTYMKFEAAVLHAVHPRASYHRSPRASTPRSRDTRRALVHRSASEGVFLDHDGTLQKRNPTSGERIKAHLRSVCKGIVRDLGRECGGTVTLPNCSWEAAMKEFILSFP